MIEHLTGSVEKVSDGSLIVDVNGVGYSVLCSARTINAVGNTSGIVRVFTVLNIREDAWTLFGFASEQERFWFNTLISVQGVGGKVALSILSVLSDEEIYNAFIAEDKNMFARADGVGPKLASRIISELKDKIVGKINVGAAIGSKVAQESGVVTDVVSALANLGYQKSDIYRVISSMQVDNDVKFDILLRQILSKLSSGV
jgi:Holliday junction DNA helicase RuvA